MPVGTSPTRNFATLGPLYLRPPFTGASATSFALRLTSCVNLPAPGRRQCVYVGLEYALAHTCVFAKQSLDAILCGRIGLGVYPLTYYRHPLFRSYGVILPSSFSVNHSSTLGYSPRLPVSDYGTVTPRPRRGAFLGSRLANPLAEACAPFGIGSRLSGRICLPGNVYRLTSAQPQSDGLLAPASPLAIKRT